MKTYNQHRDVNSKQMKKAHKELRKLRMKGGNMHILSGSGETKTTVCHGQDSHYNEYFTEYNEEYV